MTTALLFLGLALTNPPSSIQSREVFESVTQMMITITNLGNNIQITIAGFEGQKKTISIYDYTGKKLMEKNSNENVIRKNISSLSAGKYVIAVACGTENWKGSFTKS